jgi:DNA (cytosine-5)-methyltransferase 1
LSGGFDLAAEWMGWENIFHCEINPFGQRILKHYWPNAISYSDITKTDFSVHRGGIDVLTGGFPCQPFSLAGKRKGTADDRHLWPRMLEVIKQVQPLWIVGENVYGIVNWDGGLVFEQVCADLESEGYEVQPVILPACAVNAPHRRDRTWFVAHSNSNRKSNESFNDDKRCRIMGTSSDPDRNEQCEGGMHKTRPEETGGYTCSRHTWNDRGQTWDNFPTQPPLCSRNDELSSRLDGITFSKHRNESIKAYGNAVVPVLVYEIFKVIKEVHQMN